MENKSLKQLEINKLNKSLKSIQSRLEPIQDIISMLLPLRHTNIKTYDYEISVLRSREEKLLKERYIIMAKIETVINCNEYIDTDNIMLGVYEND